MNLTSSRLEQLINAPERHKVVETLGWQFGIWGVFLIFVACMLVLPNLPSTAIEWEISGASAVLGLGFVGYEVWRRRNRTVLVKDGEHILVFRKGHLDLTLALGEITRVRAGLMIMLRIRIPLAACAATFSAIGIMGILRDNAVNADNMCIRCLGFACGASLASAAWTRFSRAHLRVPIKGSRWWAEETVLIPSSHLKELFP
jgi:hypothetical protein